MTATRNQRRTLKGIVTSDAMTKTITVKVDRTFKHSKYGKYITKDSKYHAHDETGEAHVGDLVEIMETRPLSKLKRWRLIQVLRRNTLGEEVPVQPEGGAS